MPAADLTEARFTASQNVQQQFQAGTLITAMTTWCNGIVTAMNTPAGSGNPQNIAQRTIYNLVPIGFDLLNRASDPTNSGNNQFFANEISIYVARVCGAAANAQSATRISAAQGAAILALYNVAWP